MAVDAELVEVVDVGVDVVRVVHAVLGVVVIESLRLGLLLRGLLTQEPSGVPSFAFEYFQAHFRWVAEF